MRTDTFFEIPEVLWSDLSYRVVPNGEVLDFPVDYQSNYYFGLEDSDYIYLMEESTYLIAYKENEKLKINLVKKLPGSQDGSGYLLIEDIQGNLQRLFEYDGGDYTELGFRIDSAPGGRLMPNGRYECEWVVIGYIQAGNAEPEPKTDYICKWVENPRESLSGGDFGGGIDSPNRGGGSSTTACNTKTHEIYNNQCVPKCEFGRGEDGTCLSEADYWENQINDSQLKPCMQTIMADLKNLTQGVGQIVAKFAGTTPGYNWTTQDGSLSGQTAITSTSYNTNTGTVTTTFDSQAWLNASDLSWARTILHESIHAYVVAVTYNNLTDFNQRQLLLGKDWASAFLNGGHDYIANNYVLPIADALQEYGNNKGYSLGRQFYEDMAWAGLQGTSVFSNLSSTTQNRVLNVNSIELTGKNINGNTKTKKGKNAGC